MNEARVRTAVIDNARWCDAVARAAGVATTWTDLRWAAGGRTPVGFPDAVTLQPGLEPADVVAGLDVRRGCSVKDAYADVDLGPSGFRVLLTGTWLRHESPGTAGRVGVDEPRFEPVRDVAGLRAWSAAWRGDGRVADGLPEALLTDPGVVVLAQVDRDGEGAGAVQAGCVLTPHESTVGVACVFGPDGQVGATWAAVLHHVGRAHPGRAVVSWEADDEVDTVAGLGFGEVGPLRVWLHDAES